MEALFLLLFQLSVFVAAAVLVGLVLFILLGAAWEAVR